MLEAMAAANAILRLKRKVCFFLTVSFLWSYLNGGFRNTLKLKEVDRQPQNVCLNYRFLSACYAMIHNF